MKEKTPMALVPFDGQQIEVTDDDRHLVAMKSLVEGIGLDWKNCHDIITHDEVLKSTMVVTTTVAEDGKGREMVCLPLEYINGFLFKLNPKRYKRRPDLQSKLVKYQQECYKVLHQYFSKGFVLAEWKKQELIRFLDDYRRMERRAEFLEQFAPNKDDYGKIGENGLPKVFVKHGYYATEGAPVMFSEVMEGRMSDNRVNLLIEQLMLDDHKE